MIRPVEVRALPGYRLCVRYDDGVKGEVDLSRLAGRGVFALWNEPGRFERVSIGPHREIHWTEEVELCPDAMYLEITGKSPDEMN